MTHRVLTAHVPVALAKEVDSLSTKLDRPRGWIVTEALLMFVELEQKRHALTLEALAEIDAGKAIDHENIKAWADTLPRAGKKRRR
jgi:predicted transcriptional regulator